MAGHAQDLEQLEKTLRKQLEQNPLFNDWLLAKAAMDLLMKHNFQKPLNGDDSQEKVVADIGEAKTSISNRFSYTSDWNENFLHVMKQIKEGTRTDIVNEWKKLGVPNTENSLLKKASTVATDLEQEGYIEKRKVENGQTLYILKQKPPAEASGQNN